jgi:hypothetical protein
MPSFNKAKLERAVYAPRFQEAYMEKIENKGRPMSMRSDKTIKEVNYSKNMTNYKVPDSNKFNFLSNFKQEFQEKVINQRSEMENRAMTPVQ